MHISLRPAFNVLLLVVWGVLTLLIGRTLQPAPVLTLLVGFVTGSISGVLQTVSLEKNTAQFIAAETAIDVRNAMLETLEGKLVMLLEYGVLLVFACIAASRYEPSLELVLEMVVGYASLMFMRELLTLQKIFEISKKAAR